VRAASVEEEGDATAREDGEDDEDEEVEEEEEEEEGRGGEWIAVTSTCAISNGAAFDVVSGRWANRSAARTATRAATD
jgi:hypothetical protein